MKKLKQSPRDDDDDQRAMRVAKRDENDGPAPASERR